MTSQPAAVLKCNEVYASKLKPMRTVCGLDVHKDSIFVCILNENGILFQDKIGVLIPDLERLVDMLHEHGAAEVSMQSTSIY